VASNLFHDLFKSANFCVTVADKLKIVIMFFLYGFFKEMVIKFLKSD